MKNITLILALTLSARVFADNAITPLEDGKRFNEVEQIGKIQLSIEKLEYDRNVIEQNIRNIKDKIKVSEFVNVNLNRVSEQYLQQSERSEALSIEIEKQSNENALAKKEIETLQENLEVLEVRLASFYKQIEKGEKAIQTLNRNLEAKIDETKKSTTFKVDDAINGFSSKFLAMGIGFGLVLVGSGAGMYTLRRKLNTTNQVMENKLSLAKKSLEEESLSLDSKLVEVLEKQLLVAQTQQEQQAKANSFSEAEVNKEPDHSLSLKVADEITRMQRNISRMDPETKGTKPLLKGLERLRKNFMAEGYEIIDLLNKPYDPRMNIEVINFVEDPSLNDDEQFVCKVIRPQVNFNGILVQRAQVDVSQN